MVGVVMRVSQTQFPTRSVDDASIPLLTERLTDDPTSKGKVPQVGKANSAALSQTKTTEQTATAMLGQPTQPLPPLEFDVTLPPSVDLLKGELPVQTEVPATATLTLMPTASAPEQGFSFAPPSFPLPQKPALREVVSHVAITEEAAPPSEPLGTILSAAQLAQIEVSVQTAVMQAVSEQLLQEVESAVRQQVSAAFGAALRELVEPLVARLSEEAQNAIAASLRQLVAKALEAELSQFKDR